MCYLGLKLEKSVFFDEKKAGKDPLFRQKWAGILKMFVWVPWLRREQLIEKYHPLIFDVIKHLQWFGYFYRDSYRQLFRVGMGEQEAQWLDNFFQQ